MRPDKNGWRPRSSGSRPANRGIGNTKRANVTAVPDSPADLTVVQRLGALYSAVVADVLDGLGRRAQTLDAAVRPLTPTCKIFGRVFTARAETVRTVPAEPYKLEIAAVEAMKAGDVLLVEAGDDLTCGFWGEL